MMKNIRGYNCIFISYDAFRHKGQQTLIARLLDSGKHVVQIVAGNPADEKILPPATCRIVTCGSHPSLITQAFRVLKLL